jgi:hypothetical protein
MKRLKILRGVADARSGSFRSEGMRNLFALLQSELDDRYLAAVSATSRDWRSRAAS